MKGWVYVISNKAMPGLVKIGYSMQDPELRARELDHTGTPHPYVVQYDMLIEEPYQVEQKVHQVLSSYSEGKEWFRCSPEEATAIIQQVAGDKAIKESFKKADREKAEKLCREREAAEERERERKKRIAELDEEERQTILKYQSILREKFPKPGLEEFLRYWCGFFLASLFGIFILVHKILKYPIAGERLMLSSIAVGFVFALLYRNHVIGKQEESDEYRGIVKKRDSEVEALRKHR